MTLAAGTRLGPYEIVSSLGAGGMGEVYKAKDTRLDRVVAVKVLPEPLAATPELKARFEREAKAISALSHPHICALYDVGSAEGIEYLVMEYLEGETLEDRLDKGPLPIEQVLSLGVQIADALEAAHRRGIVHRDLKPGNVMLTRSGVKLLDFGLARVAVPSAVSADSSLPTEAPPSRPLTEQGTIMGTFQYMAPEQLEGKEADARSDVFALGAVLYEMATAQKAFTGATRVSLISAIMRDEPRPISAVAPMTPPAFDRLVRTCLAKDPEDRIQTAHDVKLQLQWIAEAGSQAGAPAVVASRRKSRERAAWIAAAAAAAVAVALSAAFLRRPVAPVRVVRSAIGLPAGLSVDGTDASLALSPDGRVLAIAAVGADGKTQIYLRPLDAFAATPLSGTVGASYPFWSPDGAALGFFADGKLKRVDLPGNTVQTICDAPQGRGASWGPDGTIIFAPTVYGALMRVRSAGGAPEPAEGAPSGTASHRNPHFLPGGKGILYFSFTEKGGSLFALDLATRKSTPVLKVSSEGYYVPPGWLAWVSNKTVMVQRFDPTALRLSGEPLPLAENVQYNPFRGTAEFSFAGPDLFVYQTESTLPQSQLTWFDASGERLSTVGDPAPFAGVAVDPGGRRAAVAVDSPDNAQIWLLDLARGTRTRLSLDVDEASIPVWSPDGRRLVYEANVGGVETLQVKDADGGSPAQTVYKGRKFLIPESWSPDGSVLAFSVQSADTRSFDVGILTMAGDHSRRMLLASGANELSARFSPDGRWLAYSSDESGKPELYVVPYPGPGGKWQISSGGVIDHFWAAPDEIDYVAPDGKAFAVGVRPQGAGLEIGAARPLWGGRPFPRTRIDYSRTLKRYLVQVPTADTRPSPIMLVTNWAAALKR